MMLCVFVEVERHCKSLRVMGVGVGGGRRGGVSIRQGTYRRVTVRRMKVGWVDGAGLGGLDSDDDSY